MALIGVTNCPSCHAVVNANWKTCLACSMALENHKPEHPSLQAQAPLRLADPKRQAVPSVAAVQPGMTVRCRVPVDIKNHKEYRWEAYIGRVEMIDHANHWALIIPDDETIPWRWVSLVYVEPYNNEEAS